MLLHLLNFSTYVELSLAILASVIGLVRYRQLPPSLRWLVLLAGFDMVMELVVILVHALHHENLFLIPFITVGELVLLALAYRQVLQSAVFNRAMPWVLGIFSAYAVLASGFRLDLVRHAVPLEIISYLLQVGLAGLYFQKLLNDLQVERLRAAPFFWVSVALVVHGLGALLISLSSNYMLAHCSLQLQLIVLWGLMNVFNILLYLAYCLALWMRPRQVNVLST